MTENIDGGEVLTEEFVNIDGIDTIEGVYNVLYPYYSLVLSHALNIIEKKI